jgi:hypothetical protein
MNQRTETDEAFRLEPTLPAAELLSCSREGGAVRVKIATEAALFW